MGVYEKLLSIQLRLRVPKGQYNEFGGYYYRNCEDILDAVKPLCEEYKALLVLSDDVRAVGGWVYVVARARMLDLEADGECVEVCGFAREMECKAKFDSSQLTGSASSYARKYALNGLFCIDDVKDADDPSCCTEQAWRRVDGRTYVLSDNGRWYDLGKLSMRQLQDALQSEKLRGCRGAIQRMIKEKQVDG